MERKRAKLLVLGTGAKRATTSSPAALLTPSLTGLTGSIQSLYEATLPTIRHLLITTNKGQLESVLAPLPPRLLRSIIPSLKGKLTADRLDLLERLLPTAVGKELIGHWQALCQGLIANLPPSAILSKTPTISWSAYYRILMQMQEDRIQRAAERVREGYQREELPQRALKVIGPRRNVTVLGAGRSVSRVIQPLASVKADSSLMKRAKREAINSRATPGSSTTKPKLFPPRRGGQ